MDDTNKTQELPDSAMSLGDHLEELRSRLILAFIGLAIGTIISLFFGTHIIRFIELPYNEMSVKLGAKPLTVLAPADAFVGYMKVSLVTGLVLSSPWVFYQLWAFVAAGLFPNERKYIHVAVPFCVVLFVTGALFFFFVVAPLSLSFFLGFGKFLGVDSFWTFKSYISFMTMLMIVFGAAFQTPIAIYFLNRTGLISIQALCNSRKYVLLVVFVVAAMATPPDVISQITLAVPLYALFELGILLSRFSARKDRLTD